MALWGLVWILVGGVYPAFIQAVQVDPSENVKERPYITRNITATRTAFGLDKVQRPALPGVVGPDRGRRGARDGQLPEPRERPCARPRLRRATPSTGCRRSAPTTSSMTSTSTATSYRGQPSPTLTAVRELNSADVPAGLRQQAHAVHPRLWRRPVGGQPVGSQPAGRHPQFPAERHPSGGDGRFTAAEHRPGGQDLLRRVRVRATSSSSPSSPSSTTRTRTAPTSPVQLLRYWRRTDGLDLPAGRLRPPLRRHQPADLVPRHARNPGSCTSATSRLECARRLRSSSTTPTPTPSSSTAGRTGFRTPTRSRSRYPYSQRADLDRMPAEQRTELVLQLRAQLGQGGHRRLQRRRCVTT